jgi:FkbM family methyltransferase
MTPFNIKTIKAFCKSKPYPNSSEFGKGYIDNRFLKYIDKTKIQTIFEVGARFGDEAIALLAIYPCSTIYSFDANPLTRDICENKLSSFDNIIFTPAALGKNQSFEKFFPHIAGNNPGASSFYKRDDFEQSQFNAGIDVEMITAESFMANNNINRVDLLCMDVQGYELEVLRGFGILSSSIEYVIIEEPSTKPVSGYLKEGSSSRYIGAPAPQEINKTMTDLGFREICRFRENYIEDNVLYRRKD